MTTPISNKKPLWDNDALNPTPEEKAVIRAAAMARSEESRNARFAAIAAMNAPVGVDEFDPENWEDLEMPDMSDVSLIPDTEREYMLQEQFAAWNRAMLESSTVDTQKRMARRMAVRRDNADVIGASQVYATVKTLNVIHRRRNAISIIGNGNAAIHSVEKNETLVNGHDADSVTSIAYPLLRVDNVDTLTVWPVRLTSDAISKLDNAVVNVFSAARNADSFPECQTAILRLTRALENADKLAKSHGSKCVEWNGTSEDMLSILLEYANGRTRVLKDRSRDELRAKKAHKTNAAVKRNEDDDKMTDLIVLLSSAHRTKDGVYSALVPNGDTSYALAILDGKALAEYIERPLAATEKMLLSNKRKDLKADAPRAMRGENAALSKLGEDIRRRASRSR